MNERQILCPDPNLIAYLFNVRIRKTIARALFQQFPGNFFHKLPF